METPDELGILADYRRNSISQSLKNILWEIIANRRHNPDKSTAKFVFMFFGPYFILGTNHFRDRESIEKEHTPFKFNQIQGEASAAIRSRGYGAKLKPFYIGGNYCNLFRMSDGLFTTDLKEWAMKEWINLNQLGRVIDNKEPFEKDLFRSRYYEPISKKPGRNAEVPFFCEEEFQKSPLMEFIQEHNFKCFYVYTDYNPRVTLELPSALSDLAKIYEGHDVEIYFSGNYKPPKLATFPYGYGILPNHWSEALTFDWKMGEKKDLKGDDGVKHYYESEFRLSFMNDPNHNVFYGRNDSNGSAGRKFSRRFASLKPKMDWKPQIRVTVAVTNAEYNEKKDEKDKCQELIYIRIENELIACIDAESKIASKMRHLNEPSRNRVIVDILEESIKTHPESGLLIQGIKSLSQIANGKALHEMIYDSLDLTQKHMNNVKEHNNHEQFIHADRMKEMEGHINKNLKAASRSIKRKKEGLIFEDAVGNYLASNLSMRDGNGEKVQITWEHNDATIAARHDLVGQAIDTLGHIRFSGFSVWLAVQSKDRESAIPYNEIQAFLKSVKSLRDNKCQLNPKDKVISVLSLAKAKSFNYELYYTLLQHKTLPVIEDSSNEEMIGEATEKAILSQLEQML